MGRKKSNSQRSKNSEDTPLSPNITEEMQNSTVDKQNSDCEDNPHEASNMSDTEDIRTALQQILDKVSVLPSVQTAIQGIKDEIDSLKKISEKNNNRILDLEKENTKLHEKIKKLEKNQEPRLATIEENASRMKKDILALESYSRRENLIVHGIEEATSGQEDCTHIIQHLIRNKLSMNTDVKIQRCHRLGKKDELRTKSRPIIVRFAYYCDKEEVWRKKKLLRGSKLFIDEDHTKAVQERRRVLIPVMQAARRDGQRATVQGDRLLVNGKIYITDTLNTLLDSWLQHNINHNVN